MLTPLSIAVAFVLCLFLFVAAHVSQLIASQVSVGFFGGWFGLCHIFAISIPRSRPRSPRDWRDDAPFVCTCDSV
jgi:hypothetical protein